MFRLQFSQIKTNPTFAYRSPSFFLPPLRAGESQPSVRDDYKHMQQYMDISIEQMSADFERVRTHLDIQQWLVFGGSWGSTLGIDYAERYSSVCLGLIVRGIYLNTKLEFDAIYTRAPFEKLHDADPSESAAKRIREFDTFFELAAAEVQNTVPPAFSSIDNLDGVPRPFRNGCPRHPAISVSSRESVASNLTSCMLTCAQF